MSYCRLSDDSDVYVTPYGPDGVLCNGCQRNNGYSKYFTTRQDALEHLLFVHTLAGDKVPKSAYERLLREVSQALVYVVVDCRHDGEEVVEGGYYLSSHDAESVAQQLIDKLAIETGNHGTCFEVRELSRKG